MKKATNNPANGKTAAGQKPDSTAEKGNEMKNMATPEDEKLRQEMFFLLNNTEESFVLVDTDFRIITHNSKFAELYRKYFNRQVSRGDIVIDYAQLYRRDVVKQLYLKVFAGETLQSEIEVTLPADDSVHYFINTFKPLRNEEGNVIGAFVTVSDVTDQRDAERQVREERVLLRTLIDNLPLNVYTKDLQSRKTLANRRDYEYAGFTSEDEILGKTDLELFSKESATNTIAEDNLIFSTGESIIGKEEHHIKKDGTDVWFLISKIPIKNEDGEITGLIGISYDVTERKEAQEKIRIAKERYDIVTRATNEAIWDWDMMTNQILWGDGFRALFGHDMEKEYVTLEGWSHLIHPDDEQRVINSIMDVVNSPDISKWEEEYRFRRSDGSYADVLDRGFVIRNAHRKPTRMIGAMQDISNRKESEEELRLSKEQLNKRAEELAASNRELEQFAYVASHDLQEPLRMVSSFLQLLQKKYNDHLDSTAIQYITYAVDGADRMKQLIMDLLEYSRVGTNKDKRVKVEMSEIVSQVLDTFAGKIKEVNAVVNVHTMPSIKAVKTQITQLIQNLVGNALKYNTSPVPEIDIACEEKEDAWQFSIKDNGIGIDPKFYEKVFIIFQRLHNKNQFSGTGIGLAICKKIVEKHGGTIWIESEVDKGSTFFFTIKK